MAAGPRPYEKDNADPKEFNKKSAQKQENTPRARRITENETPGGQHAEYRTGQHSQGLR